MLLDEYHQLTIRDFKGLYNRGIIDNTPTDHAFVFQNFSTRGKTREAAIRSGTAQSINVTHSVVRIFQSNISTLSAANTILTCDGAGHIYQGAGTLLLTVTGMIDFSAINLFNRTYILPILNLATSNFLFVWDGTNAPRQALGNAPTTNPNIAQAAGGNITVGTHNFAVCFVTNSGFTTTPGPIIAGVFAPVIVTFTAGNGTANVTTVPVGPAGTTQRIFLATKANLGTYFFIPAADGGVINDNTTTTATLNFPDTDLAVDASDLFNLRQSIPGPAPGKYGSTSLIWYKGRLVVLDGTTTNQINVSDAGFVENFDTVDGFVTLDSQQDQFSAGFDYYGTLYVFGSTGLHATQDNGGNPSSWTASLVDISSTPSPASLTNTLITKYPGPLGSIMLMITRQGLYAFNGNVIRPALSLKIQNIFDTFTHGAELASMLCVDYTQDIIYMLLPLNGSTSPNTLVVGDFSDGLTAEAIQWSTFSFPFTPQAIAMANFFDGNDVDYWLRIGSSTDLKKLTPNFTNDQGTAITAIWQSGLFDYGEGSIDQFRFLRVRATGSGTLSIALADQDGNNVVNPPSFTLAASPSKDLQRHINYLAEKMSVKLTVSTLNATLTINRVEMWGKQRYQMLPN